MLMASATLAQELFIDLKYDDINDLHYVETAFGSGE